MITILKKIKEFIATADSCSKSKLTQTQFFKKTLKVIYKNIEAFANADLTEQDYLTIVERAEPKKLNTAHNIISKIQDVKNKMVDFAVLLLKIVTSQPKADNAKLLSVLLGYQDKNKQLQLLEVLKKNFTDIAITINERGYVCFDLSIKSGSVQTGLNAIAKNRSEHSMISNNIMFSDSLRFTTKLPVDKLFNILKPVETSPKTKLVMQIRGIRNSINMEINTDTNEKDDNNNFTCSR